MQSNYDRYPLRQLFSALVEHAFFVEVGVCDPVLTDYMVGLLVDFVHVDRLEKFRDSKGRRLATVTEILTLLNEDLDLSVLGPRRDVHRHIGDVTLFWTGLYPERLKRDSAVINPDRLINFVDQGKTSYAIASELTDESTDPPSSLLRRLSEEFEVCVHGLGLVRAGWERRDARGTDDDAFLWY